MNGARATFVLFLLTPVPALAAPETTAPSAIAAERTRVVLRVDGPLSEERRAALERVLHTELDPHGVVLTLEAATHPAPARLPWVDGVRADPRALVAAVLEVGPTGSELYVVDAARGRAILRKLPGGAEDLALPEAVASILESAVGALREGLEVASEPVEKVVGEPLAAPPPSTPAVQPVPEPPLEASSKLAVLGGLGVNVATLGDDVVIGGNVNGHLRWGSRLGTRLGAAFFVPARVTSEYGDFRLQRSAFDVRFGWLLQAEPWTIVPELGAALELTRRTEATPRGSASATPDASHVRFGGVLGLRATVPIASFVAFDAGVHADYYTRTIELLAGGVPLTTLGRFSVGADVGVLLGSW